MQSSERRSSRSSFESDGHVAVARLWDSFNNCVEQDGTQIADLRVHAGQQDTRLGVTTVSSGWCAPRTVKDALEGDHS